MITPLKSQPVCDFCHASKFLRGGLREALIFCCLLQVNYNSGDV
jgi:predicted DNA-binding ribbon-helix-helix protein